MPALAPRLRDYGVAGHLLYMKRYANQGDTRGYYFYLHTL